MSDVLSPMIEVVDNPAIMVVVNVSNCVVVYAMDDHSGIRDTTAGRSQGCGSEKGHISITSG
jgi:hypothetical protein